MKEESNEFEIFGDFGLTMKYLYSNIKIKKSLTDKYCPTSNFIIRGTSMIASKSALRTFCKEFEKIENYEQALNDETQKWDCHHRLETHNSDGEKRLVSLSIEELKALDMYFHRPPEEFIFIPHSEHVSMHSKIRYSRQNIRLSDYVYTEEHRRHISESNKGKPRHWKNGHPMLGRHQSEKQRTSQSLIKRKAKWWTNGIIDKFCEICPDGFIKGRCANRKHKEK